MKSKIKKQGTPTPTPQPLKNTVTSPKKETIVEQLTRLNGDITKLENGENRHLFYIFTPEKPSPQASLKYLYDLAINLIAEGKKVYILTDGNYKPINYNWWGNEYQNIPHLLADNVTIQASDFIYLPELTAPSLLADFMKNGSRINNRTYVVVQNRAYFWAGMPKIGDTYAQYGIKNIITTSQSFAKYLRPFVQDANIHVVEPIISDVFKPAKEQKPFIALFSRNPNFTKEFVNSFYTQYPTLKYITFKQIGGKPLQVFANELAECCLSVWLDEDSTFGTFPLESMKCGVPVVGVIPSIVPDWMTTKNEETKSVKISTNGFWYENKHSLIHHIAAYISYWQNDTLQDAPEIEKLFADMETTSNKYTVSNMTDQLKEMVANETQRYLDKLRKDVAALEASQTPQNQLQHE